MKCANRLAIDLQFWILSKKSFKAQLKGFDYLFYYFSKLILVAKSLSNFFQINWTTNVTMATLTLKIIIAKKKKRKKKAQKIINKREFINLKKGY